MLGAKFPLGAGAKPLLLLRVSGGAAVPPAGTTTGSSELLEAGDWPSLLGQVWTPENVVAEAVAPVAAPGCSQADVMGTSFQGDGGANCCQFPAPAFPG